jgi:hypothetical protein
MLSANSDLGAWLTADEIVDLYMAEDDRPSVIDLTGGSPDLAPEWPLWMMRALRSNRLESKVYLWSDDNLSTDFLWRYLSDDERYELASYPLYGRVACFKGFDVQSFVFNTRAKPESFDLQFELMRRLIDSGIDCYCYVTFTSPPADDIERSMRSFVDRLQQLAFNLPLRTIPLRIEPYSPVVPRLDLARTTALAVQDEAIYAWSNELARRFSATERVKSVQDVRLV